MADRVEASHEMALVLLGQSPERFWRSTPSDTANLISAFRRRTNLRAMRKAWEVYHLVSPHLSEGHDLTPLKLFDSIPGIFPDDIKADRTTDGMPPGMTPDQQEEWTRRRNKKRQLRIQKPQ